jgi:hypothetical protein
MKNVHLFFGIYLVLAFTLLLSVVGMFAEEVKASSGNIVADITILAYLVLNIKKFVRAAVIVNKRQPEHEDVPMNLEV